jgi:dihydropyrimidinase
MVHCEGYDAIKFMTEKLERSGKNAPYYHAVSRPASVEREATHRAISHSELTDVPIMVVHVSGREPMEQIRWAQQRGLKIYGETCPQYVALTADDLKGLNMDSLFKGGGRRAHLPQSVCRSHIDQSRQALRALSAQGFDRAGL